MKTLRTTPCGRALLLVLVALLAPATLPSQKLSDTPRATPAGATLVVPAGWSVTTAASALILAPPEPDTHIAIVDAPAQNATAAVAAAWAVYRPDSKRPLKLVTATPARNGWDERQRFDYETSPNERAVVEAL